MNNNGNKQPEEAAIQQMELLGWIHLGGWLFYKAGKVYDLSAADLSQLDVIESNSLFVVAA